MLRRRHLHLPIGTTERDQWLLCMRQALEGTVRDEEVRDAIFGAMIELADHMRNVG